MSDKVLRIDVDQRPNATLPKRVSYSQMALYQQYGLKFYFSYLGGWREPPSAALACGSITHEIVEHLYRLPNEERSVDRAIELLREHGPRMLQMPEYRPFENDNTMKAQIRDAVENLFTVENPQEVVVDP